MSRRLLVILFFLVCNSGLAVPATYYVSTGGDDGAAGSIEAPFLTPAFAMSQMLAGDTMYIKADGDYATEDGANDCILLVDISVGTVRTIIEGYTTTPGDGGVVTFDGGPASCSYGILFSATSIQYYAFRNIEVENAAVQGFRCNGNDYVVFINCSATITAGYAFVADTYCVFERCNGGIETGGYSTLYGCTAVDCALDVFVVGASSLIFGCVIDGIANGKGGIYSAGDFVSVVNCTIDGHDVTTNYGIYLAGIRINLYNNIVRDCTNGIYSLATNVDKRYSDYNCVYSCGTAYFYWLYGAHSITGDPKHTSAGTGVYTLESDSPCINTGVGGSDMGGVGYVAVGGGGGGVVQLVGGGLVQ